jgi:hypothetical protein
VYCRWYSYPFFNSVQVVGFHEEQDKSELSEVNSDERIFSLGKFVALESF